MSNSQQYHAAAISTLAPREGSDCIIQALAIIINISTLAPREGSDSNSPSSLQLSNNFNPRSPRGERLGFCCCACDRGLFQPSLPARGATKVSFILTKSGTISTLAPREGSDIDRGRSHIDEAGFQPSLPARGATRIPLDVPKATYISTLAPREGSDLASISAASSSGISTLAPREGSD